MKTEFDVLREYIESKRLRQTPQRESVLRIFLSIDRHLSIDELHKLVKESCSKIGYTTVYRTMKLLHECGLCNEIDFGDGILKYEHAYNHEHHDHLVCTECGALIEFVESEIEKLQEKSAKKYGFVPASHKLEIFGRCSNCCGVSKKKG